MNIFTFLLCIFLLNNCINSQYIKPAIDGLLFKDFKLYPIKPHPIKVSTTVYIPQLKKTSNTYKITNKINKAQLQHYLKLLKIYKYHNYQK